MRSSPVLLAGGIELHQVVEHRGERHDGWRSSPLRGSTRSAELSAMRHAQHAALLLSMCARRGRRDQQTCQQQPHRPMPLALSPRLFCALRPSNRARGAMANLDYTRTGGSRRGHGLPASVPAPGNGSRTPMIPIIAHSAAWLVVITGLPTSRSRLRQRTSSESCRPGTTRTSISGRSIRANASRAFSGPSLPIM